MIKKVAAFFLFFIFLGVISQSSAQFLEKEIAQRASWEEFLKTAKIIDKEQMRGREAVTEPWKLTLEKEGVTRHALWKNPLGRMRGYIESWKAEIAAYQLDKYLGLNMVPVTVEKRFRGDRGSCQLWIENTIRLRDLREREMKFPIAKIPSKNRAVYLQRAFDNLIANEDRNERNILATEDWRLILIDHSRTFRYSKKFTKNLIFTQNHREGPKLMKELPRAFVEKIKTLDYDLIKTIVGEYLSDKQIKAVLLRKKLIQEEINRLINEFGEKKVLY